MWKWIETRAKVALHDMKAETRGHKCEPPSLTACWRSWIFWVIVGWISVCAIRLPGAEKFNSVYISEFLADNRHTLQDSDGNYSGWIELYNGGFDVVNLAGWFLSDSSTNLTKWQFPGVRILPGTYLVVFASDKGRTNDLAHLHTNFRLNKDGGYLGLIGPTTNVVSEFAPAYPKQTPDVSYGRAHGEPGILGYFPKPTPGKPNESNGQGFAPEVKFSRRGGSFTDPFTLAIACGSSNAVIRYTLDGRLPSRVSTLYREPLLITNTACVRARSFQDGLLPGPPQSETYLMLATNVLEFNSTLPVLVMDSFGSDRATSSH